MSQQQVVSPEPFYVEDLEEVYKATRVVARGVNAEQRRRLAQTMKQFMADAQPFRFMDLIPELRNLIYEYCVQSEEPSHWQHRRDLRAEQPSITRVCRQMRIEALPLYYVLNHFEIRVYECDFRPFIEYIDAVHASGVRSIADVHIIIKTPDDDDLRCGDALTPLLQWWCHGAPDLELVRPRFGGASLGKDRIPVGDIIDASNAGSDYLCYPKCEVPESFQRWLEAKNLKCRGEECKRDAAAGREYYGWWSKSLDDI